MQRVACCVLWGPDTHQHDVASVHVVQVADLVDPSASENANSTGATAPMLAWVAPEHKFVFSRQHWLELKSRKHTSHSTKGT